MGRRGWALAWAWAQVGRTGVGMGTGKEESKPATLFEKEKKGQEGVATKPGRTGMSMGIARSLLAKKKKATNPTSK